MSKTGDVVALKAEIDALKIEIEELKKFVKALYGMIGDGEEYDSSSDFASEGMGRYNT